MMGTCIFCKIVNGEMTAHKIYENNDTVAFLDIRPHAKGHTVIIPKKHAATVFDQSDEINNLIMESVVKVMKLIQEKLNPDGFNVGWNHNSAAGQVVPHVHVHIMPRYNGDGGGSMHSIVSNPGEITVDEVAKLFKN
jgi:histidine triad (HIT) family protein